MQVFYTDITAECHSPVHSVNKSPARVMQVLVLFSLLKWIPAWQPNWLTRPTEDTIFGFKDALIQTCCVCFSSHC